MLDFYKIINEVENSGLKSDKKTAEIDLEFNKAMDDDLNTALAISNLYGYFKKIKSALANGDIKAVEDVNQIKETYSLIGLFRQPSDKFIELYGEKKEEIPVEVKAVAEERWQARLNKDWAKSDELRNRLSELGYLVKDSKDGYTLEKK